MDVNKYDMILSDEYMNEDDESYIVMSMMYKSYDHLYSTIIDNTTKGVDYIDDVRDIQDRYINHRIKGRVVYRIIKAYNITTVDDNSDSKIIVSYDSYKKSSNSDKGKSPVFNYDGSIDIDIDMNNSNSINISIESKYNNKYKFNGQVEYNVYDLIDNESRWYINGYYNITDKSSNMKNKEKPDTIGKLYIQMKYVHTTHISDSIIYPPVINN